MDSDLKMLENELMNTKKKVTPINHYISNISNQRLTEFEDSKRG